MGTTSTNLTVTIVTATPGEDDLLLEAEIVASDNDGVTTYLVSQSYTLRLFKSTNISTLVVNTNVGTVSKTGSNLTTSVPYPDEDDEYLVFSGSNSGSLNKVYDSGKTATLVGSAYDKNGASTSAPSLTWVQGSKTVTANKECYAVFRVTYTTKYDTYSFSSSVVGPMLIFFIGTST